jgi:hypothetical protein
MVTSTNTPPYRQRPAKRCVFDASFLRCYDSTVIASALRARRLLLLGALGATVTALTSAALFTLPNDRAVAGPAIPRHLALLIAAGVAWAIAVSVATVQTADDARPRRRRALLVVAVALALRIPAYLHAPVHSDDVWRYLWDGRVQAHGINPYLHAPESPELAALRDDDWTRINHRHLPSIYPPAAQLLFRGAVALPTPPLVGWKLVCLALDVATLALLYRWLARRGADPVAALAWGWSPLVAVEVGSNAHVDVAAVALVVAALFASERKERTTVAGALVALAGAVKLVPLAILAGLRSARAVAVAVALLVGVALPFASAGSRITGSLGEYGRRWRANAGAFALLDAAAERAVAHTRFSGRTDLRDAPRLARLLTGRDRDEVYPDEIAALVARAAAALLLVGALTVAILRRASALTVAEIVFGGTLLLGPTAHPWYALPLVAIVAVRPRPAWVALAALIPLAYAPLASFLDGGAWRDPVWTRALLHGAAWALLAVDAARADRRA